MKTKNELSIFLVDDDLFSLELYHQVLNNLGYTNIASFEKSSDCLNKLIEQPDVIFLDYNMDNLNGIDILKKIKRFNPNILVLFISAQKEIQVAVDSLKYGAFDYIVKTDFTEEKIKVAMDKVEWMFELMRRKNKKSFLKRALSGAGVFSIFFFWQKLQHK
jgi:two-component SAPR family response regulator